MSSSARFVCIATILGLSACGGGGGGNSGGSSSRSYASLMQDQASFVREYYSDKDFSDDITPVSAMPRSGSATYNGTGSLTMQSATSQVAGQARLVADFRGGAINGTISNFKAAPGDSTTGGNVNLDGVIFGNVIYGTADGTVNLNGADHNFDDSVEGLFLDDADAVIIGGQGVTNRGTDYSLLVTAKTD